MSPRDHDLIEELLAVDALDGLDGSDVEVLQRERASHGDCTRCTEIETEFRELAARLALSLDPQPVDAAIADRILAAGRQDAPAVPPPPAMDDLGERRSRRGRKTLAIVAVAATLALVVGAFGAYLNGTRNTTVASASSTQRVVRFAPTTAGASGSFAMAYTPGESGVVFWGANLPDPGPDKTYEIWMVTGTTPVSGGCLRPTDGSVAAYVNADVSAADLMAVTAEPADCPSAPSGAPLLTAPLTA